jgi:hypothetical protein
MAPPMKEAAMDDIPLCPEWWPHMLWHIHFPSDIVFPHKGGGGNPVNMPAELNRVLIALASYSLTYQLPDAERAGKLRQLAHEEIVAAAQALGQSER